MRKIIMLFLFCISFLFLNHPVLANDTIYWDKEETTDAFKNWRITFNDTIDQNTVTNDHIILADAINEKELKTNLYVGKDNKSIIVESPKNGYSPDEYGIVIKNIASTSNKTVTPTVFKFSVKNTRLEEKISSLDQVVSLPKTVSILKNGVTTKVDVKWDEKSIKDSIGSTNTAEITGTIKGTNELITMQFIFDELYIKSLVDGLTFSISSEESNSGYRDAKFLQFLFNSLLKSQETAKLLKPDQYLVGHINDNMKSVLFDSITNRFLDNNIFDSSIKEEREISTCLSKLITARAFKDLADGGANGEKCVGDIFKYIFDAIGIEEEKITIDVIDKLNPNSNTFSQITASLQELFPSLEGFWFVRFTNPNTTTIPYLLEIEKKGIEYGGKAYRFSFDKKSEFTNELSAYQRKEGGFEIRILQSKKTTDYYMNYFFGHKNYKYQEVYDVININKFSPDIRGKHSQSEYHRNGYIEVTLDVLNVQLFKVDGPAHSLSNRFTYLEEKIKFYDSIKFNSSLEDFNNPSEAFNSVSGENLEDSQPIEN